MISSPLLGVWLLPAVIPARQLGFSVTLSCRMLVLGSRPAASSVAIFLIRGSSCSKRRLSNS